MLESYKKLREYIQADKWQPETIIETDGVKEVYWTFDKNRFFQEGYEGMSYDEHLNAAATQAVEIRKAFQRFQLVTELHIFEVPLALWWLLPKRFKAHQLKDS